MSYNPNATAATPQIFQAVDNITGLPLAGGQLWTYASGTVTPQAAYTDNTLTTQLPNPIILDNYGQAVIWLGTSPYRFDLFNAAGAHQAHYPVDNIQPSNFTTFTTQLAAFSTPSQGQGLVGFNPALSYPANTLPAALASPAAGQGDNLLATLAAFAGAVPRTQHQKNADVVNVKDFGAIAGGVTHQLSTVTSLNGVNTTGWTLAQWQAVFPCATSLANELDWCALQTAINSGAGTIEITGNLYCNVTITPVSGIVLQGVGQMPGISIVGNLNGINGTSINNVTIRDMTITRISGTGDFTSLVTCDSALVHNVTCTGNGNGANPSNLSLLGCTNSHVELCNFLNGATLNLFSSTGLYNGVWGFNNHVNNCKVISAAQGFHIGFQNSAFFSHCIGVGSTGTYGCGFEVDSGNTGVFFSQCVAYNHVRAGFYVEGSGTNLSQNTQFFGCEAYGNGEAGITVDSNWKNVSIFGGSLHGNTGTFGTTGYGLWSAAGSNLSVVGVQMWGNTSHGWRHFGTPYLISALGNLITGNGGWGINFTWAGDSGGTAPLSLNLAGNQITNNTSGTVNGYTGNLNATNFWDQAPCDTYTPAVSTTGTAFSLGNGTIKGAYKALDGGMAHADIQLDMGSTTTYGTGAYSFGLPIAQASNAAPQATGTAHMVHAGAMYTGVCYIAPGSGVLYINPGAGNANNVGQLVPFTWASGDRLMLSIDYRIA